MKAIIRIIAGFLASKTYRRLFLILLLIAAAFTEFYNLELARRTFVFFNAKDGSITVEDRMLKRSEIKEIDIIRYTEETLLGPAAPDLLPLFPMETRLKSLLFRDGLVYADFTQDAVLPPVYIASAGDLSGNFSTGNAAGVLGNFKTLQTGILRNFSYVKDVRFFIEGEPVFIEELRPWVKEWNQEIK